MVRYNGYPALNNVTNSGLGSLVWTIISLVVALAGCFIVYFLFLKKDVKTKSDFVAWLKEFLSFDKMLIEPILKITYLFFVIFITLSSFSLIGTSFVSFLLTLVFGNLFIRVVYEIALITIMIWKNTAEIKNKLK